MGTRKPLVGILMGSDSDLPTMREAASVLEEHGVPHEIRVLSAHRAPEATARYAKAARRRGIRVIIAGAGGAAHLAGVLAAHSTLPVIGVPLAGTVFQGTDAFLATLQMPPGVPVATVSVGTWGAKNAGILAVQILALQDRSLAQRLERMKRRMRAAVEAKDRALRSAPGTRGSGWSGRHRSVGPSEADRRCDARPRSSATVLGGHRARSACAAAGPDAPLASARGCAR